MNQQPLVTRALAIGVFGIGLAAAYFAGSRGAVSAQGPEPGRYQISTVNYSQSMHSLAIVLDTATGQVTPYVVGTNLSIDPGALRLSPFRVQK